MWKKAADCGEAPVALPEDTLLALLRTALYQGRLRTGSADGFDERLRKAVYTAHSFSDAVEKARTRRFPAARVRRALLRSVLGVETDAPVSPAYLRVLALGVRGRAVLIRQAALPVIVKPATEKRLPDALQARTAAATPSRTTCLRLHFPIPNGESAADISAERRSVCAELTILSFCFTINFSVVK